MRPQPYGSVGADSLAIRTTPAGVSIIGIQMAVWSTVRWVVTILVLLLAATEIFACDLIAPPTCLFSNQTTNDSDQGCSGDGCLCCCAHIVVVAPIVPLVKLGFISQALPAEDNQAGGRAHTFEKQGSEQAIQNGHAEQPARVSGHPHFVGGDAHAV